MCHHLRNCITVFSGWLVWALVGVCRHLVCVVLYIEGEGGHWGRGESGRGWVHLRGWFTSWLGACRFQVLMGGRFQVLMFRQEWLCGSCALYMFLVHTVYVNMHM